MIAPGKRLDFLESAVSIAITLFGAAFIATLATIVGVLVEVPVMLSVCRVCNLSRNWYNKVLETR